MRTKLVDSKQRQTAVDPTKSVIVQAPAGSGKTSLLVERYLNLLERVEEPEQILALTFTRKAALEMRYRILKRLTETDSLARSLTIRSEELNWNLSKNFERLRIQTIDSFAYSIIQRLPLVNRFGIEHELTSEPRWYYEEAATQLLEKVRDNNPFANEIASYMAKLDNNFVVSRDLLVEMLARREQWLGEIGSLAELQLKAKSSQLVKSLERSISSLRHRLVEDLPAALGKNHFDKAQRVCQFAAETRGISFNNFSQFEDWLLLCEITTTANGAPRKRLDVRSGFPAKAVEEKTICKQLISDCVKTNLIGRLGNLRDVPAPCVDEQEQETLACFTVTLMLSALELVEIFRRHKTIDFPEITLTAQKALGSDGMPSELALALDYKINHILIDEFQDTSLAQYRFLTLLISGWNRDDSNTFFAVGDPMQSIYKFRDADVTLFAKTFTFGLEQLPLEPVKLVSNFRSSKMLVDSTNAMFSELFKKKDTASPVTIDFSPSQSTIETSGSSQLVICTNDSSRVLQANLICERIKSLRHNKPTETIALLVRSRTSLTSLFPAMRKLGLTWHGIDIEPLSDIPVVRDLCALTQAVDDPNNILAWLSVLRSPLIGLELSDLEIISDSGSIQEMIDSDLSLSGAHRIGRLKNAFEKIVPHYPLRDKTETLWIHLGGADAYPDESSLLNAYKYFDLLEKKHLNERGLQQFFDLVSRTYNSDPQPNADVQIMTIHRAKGLEFDHVLISGTERTTQTDQRPLMYWKQSPDGFLIASRIRQQKPSLYDWLRLEKKEEQRSENIRLLYVAVTRAISSICFYASHDKTSPPKGSFLEMLLPFFPSPLVEENVQSEGDMKTITTNTWSRLKESYNWHPPIDLPNIGSRGIFNRSTPAAPTESDLNLGIDILGTRREIALGILIHEELFFRTTGHKLINPSDYTNWKNKLHSDGFDKTDIDWICNEASNQLSIISADNEALWFLSSERLEAESEANYTGYLDNQLIDIKIDRTFIDEEGIRWIIDYKSAVGSNNPEFIRSQVNRHRSQLIRYGRIMHAMEQRPQKLAIYLTSIGRLVEIT